MLELGSIYWVFHNPISSVQFKRFSIRESRIEPKKVVETVTNIS